MSQITIKAPGRICLFGDHQDYLELPIIACAIDRYITIRGIPNQENHFTISTPDLTEERVLCFRQSITYPLHGDHLATVLKVLKPYNCIPDKGYSIIITGDIPINAGLSSSSAVVVAWVQWLLKTFGTDREITPELVAQIAYQAEVVEQNSPGGKMDQYTSALGDILYLETDKQSSYKKLGNKLEGLIIGVSGIPKDTIGVLGDLRGNALKAIAKVKAKHPNFDHLQADLSDYDLYRNVLTSEEQRFFYAAIKNRTITQEALHCFRGTNLNYKKIGQLMTAHHTVLKDFLGITVPRIDAMITAAIKKGAYGAKIVGSGGGGSICAIAPKGKEQEIIDSILQAGAIEVYAVNVSKGVHIV